MIVKWPALVESLCISEDLKRSARELVGRIDHKQLLKMRAYGMYSFVEFKKWISPSVTSPWRAMLPALIALVPGILANAYCVLGSYFEGDSTKREILRLMLRNSKYSIFRLDSSKSPTAHARAIEVRRGNGENG